MTISANFSATRPSLLLDFSNQTVLDPRITFARTTTALYYDNKSAALAEQNLLTYSNTLTNAIWVKSTVGTPVVGITDPAGGATAYTVTASVGSGIHEIYNIPSAVLPLSTYTASVYLQAGAINPWATLIATDGNTTYASATFNLTTGVLTQSTAVGSVFVGTPSITQVGSTAWYRCAITYTSAIAAASNYVIVQLNNASTFSLVAGGGQATWTALGTETLLVYGAQFEQRSAPTVYTATTATAVNTYTPTLQVAAINSPRFDYNPTTRESLGLLLEQASTNLALYSSDYTNAVWNKNATTITATADISPDGSQNASLVVWSTANAPHSVYQTTTYTAAVWTVSVYLKNYAVTGQNFIQIQANPNGMMICNFDILNGLVGTASGGSGSPVGSIQSVGNGWWRCSMTFTATAGAAIFNICSSNSLTAAYNPSLAGNGFNGYLVWGAQVELAPSATSYIATSGSAQTRTVDSASMTGTNFSSWYNYSGGTLYLESASGNPATGVAPVMLNDGVVYNRVGLNYVSGGVNTQAQVNNVLIQNQTVALPSTIAANTFYKTAFYFSGSGNGVSSAGQTATTYATAVVAPAVTRIDFATTGSGISGGFNGRIKKFAYYPLPLTNTQIQSLSAN